MAICANQQDFITRRDCIRLIAGGAGLLVAGRAVSGEAPSVAFEGWNGPAPNLDDVRLKLLAYAILAPNAHNRQPWLIELPEPERIDLYVDRERLLPATDPLSRQIMVSQGTFIEQLDLAARALGQDATIEYFPRGMYANDTIEDRPVASVTLSAASVAERDPLFDRILERRTNKRIYRHDEPLGAGEVSALAGAFSIPEVQIAIYAEPGKVARIARICAAASALEARLPRTHHESLRALRVRPADVEKHRDGLVLASLGFEFPPMTAEEFQAMVSALLNPESEAAKRNVEESVALAEGWAFSAPAYAALVTTGNTRLHQVLAGRAYGRLNLKATELGLAIQPMSQSLQEFPEMAVHYTRIHEEVAARSGHTLQMLPRLGHAEPVPPTPRRDPRDLVAG